MISNPVLLYVHLTLKIVGLLLLYYLYAIIEEKDTRLIAGFVFFSKN